MKLKTKTIQLEIPEDSELFLAVVRSNGTQAVLLYPGTKITSTDITNGMWSITKTAANYFMSEKNLIQGTRNIEQCISIISDGYINKCKTEFDYTPLFKEKL